MTKLEEEFGKVHANISQITEPRGLAVGPTHKTLFRPRPEPRSLRMMLVGRAATVLQARHLTERVKELPLQSFVEQSGT